jgi:hypothetical protein
VTDTKKSKKASRRRGQANNHHDQHTDAAAQRRHNAKAALEQTATDAAFLFQGIPFMFAVIHLQATRLKQLGHPFAKLGERHKVDHTLRRDFCQARRGNAQNYRLRATRHGVSLNSQIGGQILFHLRCNRKRHRIEVRVQLRH